MEPGCPLACPPRQVAFVFEATSARSPGWPFAQAARERNGLARKYGHRTGCHLQWKRVTDCCPRSEFDERPRVLPRYTTAPLREELWFHLDCDVAMLETTIDSMLSSFVLARAASANAALALRGCPLVSIRLIADLAKSLARLAFVWPKRFRSICIVALAPMRSDVI